MELIITLYYLLNNQILKVRLKIGSCSFQNTKINQNVRNNRVSLAKIENCKFQWRKYYLFQLIQLQIQKIHLQVYRLLSRLYLLSFLDCDFPSAPRDVVHVEKGKDLEQEVHGGYHKVVNETAGQTPELLRVQHGRYNERRGHRYSEEGRGGQPAVFRQLEDQGHGHHAHHQRVESSEHVR